MADGAMDARALRAATGISHAEEKRIALSLPPAVAETSRIEGLVVGPHRHAISG